MISVMPHPHRSPCLGRVIASGLLACLPAIVHAQDRPVRQCTIQSDAASIAFNGFSIPRDAVVGTALSEVVTTAAQVTCPANPADYGGPSVGGPGFYLQLFPSLRLATGVTGVWATGTQGVGVRVISVDFRNAVVSSVGTGSKTDFGPRVARSAPYTGTYRFSYQLIKTGQIVGTGHISTGNMFALRSHNIPANVTSAAQAQVFLRDSAFNALTCRVTTPSVDVPLRNVNVTELRTRGDSAGRTNFLIGLQCDAGSNVHITLTDATRPANRTNLLTLTSASTARGVRIRIRNPDDNPVRFGPDSPVAGNTNQWRVGASDATDSIAMSAEYVASGTVSPGTVRALATFTMSYQ